MPFTPKPWENRPSDDTPVSAAGLIDLEERVTDYSDSVAAAGVELGYAQITANFNGGNNGTLTDVTGLTTTVTVAARPIIIRFSCGGLTQLTANKGYAIGILEDGSVVSRAQSELNAALHNYGAVFREVRRAPAAGSHTYKIQLASSSATGTATIGADSGTTYGPAFIQVLEV